MSQSSDVEVNAADIVFQLVVQEQYGSGQRIAGGLLLRPSPEMMLCSCLIFGCCVSSFIHRRQEEDDFQFVVYALFLAGALVVGHALQGSANLIFLGYMPWAMSAAMFMSLSGHTLYRARKLDSGPRPRDEEKARPLT